MCDFVFSGSHIKSKKEQVKSIWYILFNSIINLWLNILPSWGFSGDSVVIHLQCRKHRIHRFDPWVGKISWRRTWQLTPGFLPGESHGQRSLGGCSPQGHKEADTTEATWHTRIFLHKVSDSEVRWTKDKSAVFVQLWQWFHQCSLLRL